LVLPFKPTASVHSHTERNGSLSSKPNQDCVRVLKSDDLSHSAVILADGHGTYGHIASEVAVKTVCDHFLPVIDNLYEYFRSFAGATLDDEKEIQQIFDDIFSRAHSAVRNTFLLQNGAYNVKETDPHGVVRINSQPRAIAVSGGTTLTVVLSIQMPDLTHKIICANVGDSEALMLKLDSSQISTSLVGDVEILTQDHSPNNIREYHRIKDLDSDAYPRKLVAQFNKSSSYRKFIDVSMLEVFNSVTHEHNPIPPCAFQTTVRGDYSIYACMDDPDCDQIMLAMTRAIGDFAAQQYGLTYLPSVSVRTVEPISSKQHFMIIVASDGLWDCVKYDDFSKLVGSSYDDYAAASVSTSATSSATSSAVSSVFSASVAASAEMSESSFSKTICSYGLQLGMHYFGSSRDDITVGIIHYM
jgi:serine/threonine protein phosphatase PrpC